MGSEIEIQEASEPTDIIWENRSFTPKTRNIKRIFVYLTIMVMLSFSGYVIFNLTKKSLALKQKYPKINCDNIAETYEGENDKWLNDAYLELQANLDLAEQDKETHYQGVMQCFCLEQKETDNDFKNDKTFTIS